MPAPATTPSTRARATTRSTAAPVPTWRSTPPRLRRAVSRRSPTAIPRRRATRPWQVAAGADGTDLLTGVEKVTDSAGHSILLVGNGGYASIQAAINAAVAGDT